MFYPLGKTLGLGSGYGNYADFYGGMKMLGIAFMANGVLDLAVLIILAVRNRKAARAEAIAEASAMIADTKREEIALPAAEPEEAPVFAPADEETVVIPAPPAEPAPAPAPAPVAPVVVIPADPALNEPAPAKPVE